jgi:hypothetical protein
MRSDKLSMRIYQDEEGLKLVVIHSIAWRLTLPLGNQGFI